MRDVERHVERRPVLCSFKRIEGSSACQKIPQYADDYTVRDAGPRLEPLSVNNYI